MIRDDFRVESANWAGDGDTLRAIREQVFVVEQRVPVEEEVDALDPISRHVVARDTDGNAIATARLTPKHTIGRMAVLGEWRGKGVGEALLRTLVEQARMLGWPEVTLDAQTHAIAFYERAGFIVEGPEFLDCDIPHRVMRLALRSLPAPPAQPLPEQPEQSALQAGDRAEALAATLALLAHARHAIALQTRDLDAGLLDAPAVVEAVKRIALSGRRARVRILVQEPRKAIADGHALIRLAQQLPSAIALRVPVEERDLGEPSAFLVDDRGGYFLRPLSSRMEGEGSTFAPGRHRQLVAAFDEIWERSLPSAELRVLAI